MKKTILSIVTIIIILFSCQKEKCKDKQASDLKTELLRFQNEVGNYNLTQEQIKEITKRHEEREKKILAQCN